jgi:hypothetical protein
VTHIINDIGRIRADPHLKDMTIGILSFYKAQVTRLKAACYDLPGITVLDGNEHVSAITALSASNSWSSFKLSSSWSNFKLFSSWSNFKPSSYAISRLFLATKPELIIQRRT